MTDIRVQIAEKLAEVHAYRGSEVYTQFVNLLGLIGGAYDEDLRTVTPENLRYKQGASAQARLLREILISGGAGDIPKV